MRAVRIAVLFAAALSSPDALAETPGDTPLGDLLTVLVDGRDVLAIDANSGGQTAARLRLDEQVLWKGARGAVGVAITDQRVLAVATQSSAWQEIDYLRTESPPHSALLGDRVALVVTARRVVGFDGGSGNLVEYSLGPREEVLDASAGANVAVVVTDRSALGLSPFLGGFFAAAVDLGDAFERVETEANVATLLGARRLLIFRATSGAWEERVRSAR